MDMRYRDYRRLRPAAVKIRFAALKSHLPSTRKLPMPAYIVANVDVTDPEAYADYRKGVAASLEPYGGRFLARGGRAEALEGSYAAKRVVIIAFPDYDRAKAWWDSPGYRDLRDLRQRASRGDLLVVEGV